MKILYYFLHWTWNLICNLIAAIIALVLIICGAKIKKYRNAIHIEVKYNWGGCFSLGMFLFTPKYADLLLPHEYGHTIQGMVLGPLYLIIVALPSVIRYWYREYIYHKDRDKYYNLPDYDAIWFEGQATSLGEKTKNNEIKGL